jgi:hypothetical protein
MARKGILLSSPDVQNMSRAQWAAEYIALKTREKEEFERYFKSMRNLLISVLGLNALRPMDETGKIKSFDEMTEEEFGQNYTPLVAWVGRIEMLKAVKDQIEGEKVEKEIGKDEEYEKLVAAIDAVDGDMEPILGIEIPKGPSGKPVNPAYQQQLKELVRPPPINIMEAMLGREKKVDQPKIPTNVLMIDESDV